MSFQSCFSKLIPDALRRVRLAIISVQALLVCVTVISGCTVASQTPANLAVPTGGVNAQAALLDSTGNSVYVVQDGVFRQFDIVPGSSKQSELNAGGQSLVFNKTLGTIDHDVSYLRLDTNGDIWLVGLFDISRWNSQDGVCTLPIKSGTPLLVIPPNRDDNRRVNIETYIDGAGVVAMVNNVGDACSLTEAGIQQPFVTVIIQSPGTPNRVYKALSATIKAGPTTVAKPSIDVYEAGKRISSLSVFDGAQNSHRIVDMVVSNNHALILSNANQWELWDLENQRKTAAGLVPIHTHQIHVLSDRNSLIVGDTLIDIKNASAFRFDNSVRIQSISEFQNRILKLGESGLIITDEI